MEQRDGASAADDAVQITGHRENEVIMILDDDEEEEEEARGGVQELPRAPNASASRLPTRPLAAREWPRSRVEGLLHGVVLAREHGVISQREFEELRELVRRIDTNLEGEGSSRPRPSGREEPSLGPDVGEAFERLADALARREPSEGSSRLDGSREERTKMDLLRWLRQSTRTLATVLKSIEGKSPGQGPREGEDERRGEARRGEELEEEKRRRERERLAMGEHERGRGMLGVGAREREGETPSRVERREETENGRPLGVAAVEGSIADPRIDPLALCVASTPLTDSAAPFGPARPDARPPPVFPKPLRETPPGQLSSAEVDCPDGVGVAEIGPRAALSCTGRSSARSIAPPFSSPALHTPPSLGLGAALGLGRSLGRSANHPPHLASATPSAAVPGPLAPVSRYPALAPFPAWADAGALGLLDEPSGVADGLRHTLGIGAEGADAGIRGVSVEERGGSAHRTSFGDGGGMAGPGTGPMSGFGSHPLPMSGFGSHPPPMSGSMSGSRPPASSTLGAVSGPGAGGSLLSQLASFGSHALHGISSALTRGFGAGAHDTLGGGGSFAAAVAARSTAEALAAWNARHQGLSRSHGTMGAGAFPASQPASQPFPPPSMPPSSRRPAEFPRESTGIRWSRPLDASASGPFSASPEPGASFPPAGAPARPASGAFEDTMAGDSAGRSAGEVLHPEISPRDPPPGALTVPLMRHQREALGWMARRERAGTVPRGGILADDQGLGKTVTILALIHSDLEETRTRWRMAQNEEEEEEEGGGGGGGGEEGRAGEEEKEEEGGEEGGAGEGEEGQVEEQGAEAESRRGDGGAKEMTSSSSLRRRRRTCVSRPRASLPRLTRSTPLRAGTLVVCPASVAPQWCAEAVAKTDPSRSIRVHAYDGPRAGCMEALLNADLVLVSYQMLVSDWTSGGKDLARTARQKKKEEDPDDSLDELDDDDGQGEKVGGGEEDLEAEEIEKKEDREEGEKKGKRDEAVGRRPRSAPDPAASDDGDDEDDGIVVVVSSDDEGSTPVASRGARASSARRRRSERAPLCARGQTRMTQLMLSFPAAKRPQEAGRATQAPAGNRSKRAESTRSKRGAEAATRSKRGAETATRSDSEESEWGAELGEMEEEEEESKGRETTTVDVCSSGSEAASEELETTSGASSPTSPSPSCAPSSSSRPCSFSPSFSSSAPSFTSSSSASSSSSVETPSDSSDGFRRPGRPRGRAAKSAPFLARSRSLSSAAPVLPLCTNASTFSSLPSSFFSRLFPARGNLFRVTWRRVALDEAQAIRGAHTRASRLAARLEARARWCVSGTPVQNHVRDLFGHFRFLRFAPYADARGFRERLAPRGGANPAALARAAETVRTVTLRRTKRGEGERRKNEAGRETEDAGGTGTGRTAVQERGGGEAGAAVAGAEKVEVAAPAFSGRREKLEPSRTPAFGTAACEAAGPETAPCEAAGPGAAPFETAQDPGGVSSARLPALPPRLVRTVCVPLDPPERAAYALALEASRDAFSRSGGASNRMIGVLASILRTRQICDHAALPAVSGKDERGKAIRNQLRADATRLAARRGRRGGAAWLIAGGAGAERFGARHGKRSLGRNKQKTAREGGEKEGGSGSERDAGEATAAEDPSGLLSDDERIDGHERRAKRKRRIFDTDDDGDDDDDDDDEIIVMSETLLGERGEAQGSEFRGSRVSEPSSLAPLARATPPPPASSAVPSSACASSPSPLSSLPDAARLSSKLRALLALLGRILAGLEEGDGEEDGTGRGCERTASKTDGSGPSSTVAFSPFPPPPPPPPRVLVFSQWTSMLDLIERALAQDEWPHDGDENEALEAGETGDAATAVRDDTSQPTQPARAPSSPRPLFPPGTTWLRLDGSTPARRRAEALASFRRPGSPARVLLLSLQAAATGLDLHVANHVILVDPWFNPTVEDQAMDRAHRIGQTRPVRVTRLLAQGSIEERILELQRQKRKIVERLFEEGNATKAAKEAGRLSATDIGFLVGGGWGGTGAFPETRGGGEQRLQVGPPTIFRPI